MMAIETCLSGQAAGHMLSEAKEEEEEEEEASLTLNDGDNDDALTGLKRSSTSAKRLAPTCPAAHCLVRQPAWDRLALAVFLAPCSR
eukprot:CAMPEP_0194755756 /NCGR_PEP_ID=MMETSP0323_2-20130528/9582_1 /TAXON_ID=2866 ORGANISM="Crypthecodinium cohnii, Strain Seligo" /NCGR_SAMPLE_ID=MMETSP0323_2 /ASSEMBLY_ACC=CAM_ASM_000346 /LENGTH=86 /DNA_ID=CAMNT_0039674973 /DNA_START=708 /DNA_END=965 /DNA_ORIENTATION=+